MSQPVSATPREVPPSLVRAELERILASDVFSRSERLSAFLRFIVEETLRGQGHGLKEQVIAVELYGKGADFNTAVDPIVRVDARRLRDKLREYYASAPNGAAVISVPKGSYTPVFEFGSRAAAADGDVEPARTESGHTRATVEARPVARGAAIAALALAAIAGLVGLATMSRRGTESGMAPRLLTATAFPGAEEDPSLSPDGNFVVFSWPGPASNGNDDIWIKAVEGDTLRRLTETPDALEKFPEWSPDGRYITFSRTVKDTWTVYVVSALGGHERLIAEGARMSSWTPDGQALVMSSLTPARIFPVVHHVLESGVRRTLTEPPAGFSDMKPRVSPDGKTVAFQRSGADRSAIFVVPVNGGEERQIGEWVSGTIGGLSWTPDGREILYGEPVTSGRRLVRATVDGSEPQAEVAGVPFGSVNPTVSRFRSGGTYRLAISSSHVDVGLRMVDLRAPLQGKTIPGAAPFADATRVDLPGRFSPDGTQVAFVSDRGGSQQVWVAGRDGSALRSVTILKNATVNVGSWSPDGQRLVFDASVAGNTDIYAVRTDGGSLKRLTQSSAIEIDAEWSHDGGWIYYSSDESGTPAIWKMPADGGKGVQLTVEAGFEPRQSPDGRILYFVNAPRTYGLFPVSTLKQCSTDGGAVTTVLSGVIPGAWEVTDSGVVFGVPRARPLEFSPEPDELAFYDFAGRRVRSLGVLAFRIAPFSVNRHLTVSRDGRWMLANHIDKWDRDIMVVDHFK
jgi:Tol biopolymer transport system component